MTKNEYLAELSGRLVKLPETERDDALAYYTEYIEDADNDEAAIAALGTPARLATQIAAEYSARMLSEGPPAPQPEAQNPAQRSMPVTDFSALQIPSQNYTTYVPPVVPQQLPSAVATEGSYNGQSAAAAAAASPYVSYEGQVRRHNSLNWIWFVVLGIFALPVALPVAIAALALVVTLVALCFALIVAAVAVVGSLIVASIATFIASFGAMSWGAGLLGLGGAISILGLALLVAPLLILFCIWLVDVIGKLISKIFNSLKRSTDNNEEK